MLTGYAFVAKFAVDFGVFNVQVEANFFKDRLGVSAENGMYSALYELIVKLLGICNIKIPNEHKVARRPSAFAPKRMACVFIVIAAGSVPEMPD